MRTRTGRPGKGDRKDRRGVIRCHHGTQGRSEPMAMGPAGGCGFGDTGMVPRCPRGAGAGAIGAAGRGSNGACIGLLMLSEAVSGVRQHAIECRTVRAAARDRCRPLLRLCPHSPGPRPARHGPPGSLVCRLTTEPVRAPRRAVAQRAHGGGARPARSSGATLAPTPATAVARSACRSRPGRARRAGLRSAPAPRHPSRRRCEGNA